MEQLIPDKLAERIREEEEEEATDDICLGGFKAWQEVAANRDVIFGSRIGVKQGTPGIIIGNFTDGSHVTVKFDEREDGSELCVNLLPEALMTPLPGGFRLGQRVVALYDLLLNEEIGVRVGTSGVIVGRLGEGDRLMVLFDLRVDKGEVPEGPVSVSFREVTAQRPLIGGFGIAQRVQSAMELVVGTQVVAQAGARGVVLAEFSDTRLTVAFDAPAESGGRVCFNVLPLEIRPWCEAPGHLPVGTHVCATEEISNGGVAPVPKGVMGVVLGGVEEGTVLASFEGGGYGAGPQTAVVEARLLKKVTRSEDVDALPAPPTSIMEEVPPFCSA